MDADRAELTTLEQCKWAQTLLADKPAGAVVASAAPALPAPALGDIRESQEVLKPLEGSTSLV